MPDGKAVQTERHLVPQTLAQLAPFELRAKMIVEGVMSGAHRSPYQGMAVEFAEHRQYVAGDDPKHLDWKVLGRTDRLYIKQYQQETNLDVILLVDASASMSYGKIETDGRKQPWSKFDHAAAMAAAIAYLCLHQQDRVGLVTFADDVIRTVVRSSAQMQWSQIIEALSIEPVETVTDLAGTTNHVLSEVGNRVLFVIISDFFDDASSIRSALARFKHQRQDVILLNTLDRTEMRFDFTQAAPFEGLEGEGRLRIDPRALREAYLESLSEHLASTASMAREFGFDYHRVDTHESVGPPLAHMLARRNSLLKRRKLG